MIGNYNNQPDLDKVFRGLMGSKESSSHPKPGRGLFPSSGDDLDGRHRAQAAGILSVGDIRPASQGRHADSMRHNNSQR